MIRKNYLLFNCAKLRYDVELAVFKKEDTTLTRELTLSGANGSFFPNSYRNYCANKIEIDYLYEIPTDAPRLGWIGTNAYERVIKRFGLEDIYRIPLKGEKPVETKPEEPAPSITSEEIHELNNSIITLTKAIMVLADKMPAVVNTFVKPKAYLNKEEK